MTAAPRALAIAVLLITLGCTVATPRFSPPLQAAVADSDMQRLETEKLIIYYAKGSRDEALRVASRLEYCRREVERFTKIKDGPAEEKSIFVLPRIEYNNAYVNPPMGIEQIAFLPEYATAHGLFTQLGLPPDPGTIGCHEMVHDTHARQVSGAAAVIRKVLGNYYTPQSGFDPWFWEGLAVYFETRLQSVGRLANPYFDGHFAAGVAGTTITGDDLNGINRAYKFGAMYLVGSRFIDYLARTHGEEKLWEVIKVKSSDVAFPLAVNNAFKQVYGKNLSALIDDFAEDTKRNYPVRARPDGQHMLRAGEQSMDFFLSRSGHSVVLKEGLDQQARITVYDPAGHEVLSHLLNDLGVGRRLIRVGVDFVSGLSMTADGMHVYFVAADVGSRSGWGDTVYASRLVHVDVANDELEVLDPDMHGSGGSVSPDGSRYYFARATDDSLGLHYYELPSLQVHDYTPPPKRMYLTMPMVSPDGSKLAVTEASDAFLRLAIYDAATGERLQEIPTPDGFVMQPTWVDDTRIVYVGADGRRVQVFETDLVSGAVRKLTEAPYAVSKPFSNGQQVRFLNREGWAWSEDTAPYPENVMVAEEAVPADALEPPPVPAEEQLQFAAAANEQRPNDTEVVVQSERPYSAFERVLIPQNWGPMYTLRDENHHALGLFLTGGDRLGFHRWAVYGAWDVEGKLPTAGISYINSLAAPFSIVLNGAYIGRVEDKTEDIALDPVVPVNIRETVGSLAIVREWFASTTVGVGARYAGAIYERESDKRDLEEHRFAGPMAQLGYRSFDSTPYGGARRGFGLDLNGTYFPSSVSTESYDITDAQGELTVVVPLPISKRHKLIFETVGRGLFGTPDDSQLLQLGGGGNATIPVASLRGDQADRLSGGGVLPPALRFFQPLRGFEDEAIFGRYAVLGEATYHYPFIFDWGTATALRFLPAVGLRQIDLELFFTGASLVDKGRESALATGASLDFRVQFWLIPISLRFQGSRRLSYDENFAFFFGIMPGA